MTLFKLQTLVTPSIAFSAPVEMYARPYGSSYRFELKTGQIVIDRNSAMSFDTFFNSVSVETWKRECQIDDLFLVLRGSGRFLLRFGVHRIAAPQAWLDEIAVELTEGLARNFPLPFWSGLGTGMLYFELVARDDGCVFSGGFFATSTPPVRDVKLGVVITHFNRKNWVLPAIGRIRDGLLADPDYSGRIELIVVDNSQTITDEEARDVTLIPNRNVGGSGGFCRGLMHLEDQGEFTHCLFMDDDASCEIESLRRAYALLGYATKSNIAVAGSLLRELEPFRTHEVGATFDGSYHPVKSGLDTRDIKHLLELERRNRDVNYGGWWFFGFSLKEFKHYPFPFFVRGDDVLFSLMNDFHIVTMNGIACWGEDFWYKESPMTRYLWARATLVMLMSVTEKPFKYYFRTMKRWFKDAAYSYHYDSAHIFTLALRHVMQGPTFFVDNLDMDEVRKSLANYMKVEKLAPIERSKDVCYPRAKKASVLKTFIRKATCNGQLLPSVLWKKKKAMFQPKGYGADQAQTYRYRYIHYEHEPLHVGFVLEVDRRRFIDEAREFLTTVWIFHRSFDKLKRRYRDALPEYTNRAFWERVFETERSNSEAAKDNPGLIVDADGALPPASVSGSAAECS